MLATAYMYSRARLAWRRAVAGLCIFMPCLREVQDTESSAMSLSVVRQRNFYWTPGCLLFNALHRQQHCPYQPCAPGSSILMDKHIERSLTAMHYALHGTVKGSRCRSFAWHRHWLQLLTYVI
jgi:hypothetical protein